MKTNNSGVAKQEVFGNVHRDLTSQLLYTFTTGWNLTKDKATSDTTFSRSDSGNSDLNDTLSQNSNFHDVQEWGDFNALNHDWKKLDFARDTLET